MGSNSSLTPIDSRRGINPLVLINGATAVKRTGSPTTVTLSSPRWVKAVAHACDQTKCWVGLFAASSSVLQGLLERSRSWQSRMMREPARSPP